jgi:putative transposase
VRAGIVSCADEYRWTSYAIHALGRESEWVVPHPVCVQLGDSSDSRQRAYRALCSEPIARRDMLWLREARPSRQQQEVAHSAPGMRIA